MLFKIRKHFTYTNVAMTLALVFVMTGGAFAASKFVITSTKQIKPSVLAQLRGKTGTAGRTGSAGPQGPGGLQGPPGANGKDGTNGSPGESVATSPVTGSETACSKLGGTKFTVGGKETLACNGKAGTNGSPWTAGGTLPEGSSERGQWVISTNTSAPAFHEASISFPVPLAAALSETNVHRIGVEEGSGEPKESTAIKSGECSGTWENLATTPIKAASKNLCIFVAPGGFASNLSGTESAESESSGGAGVSGALLQGGIGSGLFILKGSWVVTG
jgi:hypothetical protein